VCLQLCKCRLWFSPEKRRETECRTLMHDEDIFLHVSLCIYVCILFARVDHSGSKHCSTHKDTQIYTHTHVYTHCEYNNATNYDYANHHVNPKNAHTHSKTLMSMCVQQHAARCTWA
jgi:hypothetical protein